MRVVDSVSRAKRSQIMAAVRHKDTRPEITVRRLLHRMGYRYRLHARDLPGRPDIVLPKHRAVVEVRGCFWHRHPGCSNARLPKSRRGFWLPKLRANRLRDLKNERRLRALDWNVLVVWECEVGSTAPLTKRLQEFLSAKR
jgi:DNA mismatch endonuclease (patch repair protein)